MRQHAARNAGPIIRQHDRSSPSVNVSQVAIFAEINGLEETTYRLNFNDLKMLSNQNCCGRVKYSKRRESFGSGGSVSLRRHIFAE